MNASAKWLRRSLLGGVALGAMATGAQADELADLKAQLEALQSRVNQIETQAPATSSAMPEGASYITFRRGSDIYETRGPNRLDDQLPEDRGFTVAITPTADLPAPVMEVSVSGYVKGDVIYDTHNNLGVSASPGNIAIGGGDDENVQLHAFQSRFRIKSTSDTAVGQIRTLIEGDFEGVGGARGGFRLRHAWGEWDMTPDLTFGAGQTWSTHYHFAGEIPTVDFSGLLGTSGFNRSRLAQVQLSSSAGPVGWAVAIQDPNGVTLTNPAGTAAFGDEQLPDLAARATFEMAGAQVGVSALVGELHCDGSANGNCGGASDSEIRYGFSAGFDLPLGEWITLRATGGYGHGAIEMSGAPGPHGVVRGGNIDVNDSYGFAAGASLKLSEASSINAAYSTGWNSNDGRAATGTDDWSKIHVNYLWQPVNKLRMGLEGIYAEREIPGGADDDNLRIQFGTWFFF